MPFWSKWSWPTILKTVVGVAGGAATLAAGVYFGQPVAEWVAAGTAAVVGIIDAYEREEEDRKRRKEEQERAIVKANEQNSREDIEKIIKEAHADLDKEEAIRNKLTLTYEDQQEAHELITQARLKVGGI